MNYIFSILEFHEKIHKKFHKKKVKINKICNVILIPSRSDINAFGLKNDIWYSLDELNLMRTNYIIELHIISQLNNVTLNEARKIWKKNN